MVKNTKYYFRAPHIISSSSYNPLAQYDLFIFVLFAEMEKATTLDFFSKNMAHLEEAFR